MQQQGKLMGSRMGQLFNLVPSYSPLGCQDIPTEKRTLEEEMKKGRKSPEQTLPAEGLVNAQVQEGGVCFKIFKGQVTEKE